MTGDWIWMGFIAAVVAALTVFFVGGRFLTGVVVWTLMLMAYRWGRQDA